jgi:hypothetical protein
VRPTDDNPGVRLIFAGMMVFTYKGKEGRVVFHRGPEHKLEISVRKNCVEIFNSNTLNGGRGIGSKSHLDLRIKNKPSDGKFYKTANFDRRNDASDAKDFGWLLDLENSPYSHIKLDRTQDKFSTKLKVGHGTFYTYQHTDSKFKSVLDQGNAGNSQPVGHVAMVMAADIELADGACVSFLIGKHQVVPPLCNDAKYEIWFSNVCLNCMPSEGSYKSDFPMAFDAVHADSSQKFHLELDGPKGNPVCPPPGPCADCVRYRDRQLYLSFKDDGPFKILLTDEAPCMGGGLGFGGGFP